MKFLVILYCLSCILAVFAPRALGTVIPASCLLLGAWHWKLFSKETLLKGFALPFAVACLTGLSLLWSTQMADSTIRFLKLIPHLLSGGIFISFCLSTPNITLTKSHIYFLSGTVLLCVIFLGVELFFEAPIYQLIHQEIIVTSRYETFFYNRSLVALLILALPLLYILYREKMHFWLMSLIIFISITALISQSQTVQLSLLVFLIAFKGYTLLKTKAIYAFGVFFIFGLLSLPWLLPALHGSFAKWPDSQILEMSYAAERLTIWTNIALAVQDNLFLGHGIETVRSTVFDGPKIESLEQNNVLHPHNMFLQIWFEFGILGVLPVIACVLLLLKKIKNHDPVKRTFVLSYLTTLFTIASVSYGLWQSWWVGLIFFVTGCTIVFMKEKEWQQLS